MADFIRVKWRGLKPERESSIAAHRFDPEKHERLTKPAVDNMGKPLDVKFHSSVDELVTARPQRATGGRTPAAPQVTEANQASDESGHRADTPKEND